VLAGSFIATGAAIPQLIAFQEYCTHGSGPYMIRPWCKSYVPSIYTFVQSYYW
jgi:phosphatidylinositol glycan class V